MTITRHRRSIVLLLGIVAVNFATADEMPDARTIIGPSNIKLADGAQALREGDGEEGVRLTLLGLASAQGQRERIVALANLCAGYLLLDQTEEALGYCDRALAENDRNWHVYNNRALVYLRLKRFEEAEDDIVRGQELAPNSKSLKVVKGMFLDETSPVLPNIIIDDRREPVDDER